MAPSIFSTILPTCSASSRSLARSGPKTLTSIGLCDARQVVDLVLDQRDKLRLQLGDLFLELLAKRVEDLGRRAALARGLQAHEDVAGIALGGEEAELGARAADVARDVGRLEQDLLHPAEDPVGLGQRGAHRHVVVEHEGPLVHLGHEAGLQRGSPGHSFRSETSGRAQIQPGITASSASSMAVFGKRSPNLRARS